MRQRCQPFWDFPTLIILMVMAVLVVNVAELKAEGMNVDEGAADSVTAGVSTAERETLSQEARKKVLAFAGSLKQILQRSMQKDGPVAAISLCNVKAPVVAERFVRDGWQLARTSLRVRNSDNAPDAWERSVLTVFEQRLGAGEPISSLEASQVSGDEFRFMKAIPVAEVCLKCHGNNIAPELQTKLDQLYPEDKAHDFKVGDIRGAFSVSTRLEAQNQAD